MESATNHSPALILTPMNRQLHMGWGHREAGDAAERGDLLVVVDVLRFTSAATTAAAHGAIVRPLEWTWGAAVGTKSPVHYIEAEVSKIYDVSSPNGAMCCRHGGEVLAGSLLNAAATAAEAMQLASAEGTDVTVLACGERWHDTRKLRFALEDYLGAGAILSHMRGSATMSADAELCARAFDAAGADLERLVRECPSGRELVEWGKGSDVDHACRLDLYDVAVVKRDGLLVPASGSSA